MVKTVLNVKTDKDIKEAAQKVAKEIGVPLSTVVNAYLKEFVRSQSVTFTTSPRLRKEIIEIFEQAESEPLTGKENSPIFDNIDDAFDYLENAKV